MNNWDDTDESFLSRYMAQAPERITCIELPRASPTRTKAFCAAQWRHSAKRQTSMRCMQAQRAMQVKVQFKQLGSTFNILAHLRKGEAIEDIDPAGPFR